MLGGKAERFREKLDTTAAIRHVYATTPVCNIQILTGLPRVHVGTAACLCCQSKQQNNKGTSNEHAYSACGGDQRLECVSEVMPSIVSLELEAFQIHL